MHMTVHDVFGLLAALLAGVLLCELNSLGATSMAASKKNTPFDLGAAYAAKLSANDGQVEFAIGGANFVMPSAAGWTEEQLKKTSTQSPFEVIREALGDDEYKRLIAATEEAGTPFGFGMAARLLEFYMQASGLGAPGES